MADQRKLHTYEVNGIKHTALLDEDDAKRLKAKVVVHNKARTAQNKGGADTGGAHTE